LVRGRDTGRAMSRENVEAMRVAVEAIPGSGFLSVLDEEVEFHAPDWLPESGLYRGPEAVAKWFRRWIGTWDDYEAEAHEYIDGGPHVVVEHVQRGRGKQSGVSLEGRHWSVYTFRGRRVVCWRSYRTREEALEAVGLRE
jgi:ketosteroid isomerase-like protein